MPLVLFNPLIGPSQVLPRRPRVDLGTMAIKEYSAFPKAPALLEPHHQIVYCHTRTLCREAVGVFYSHRLLGKLKGLGWLLLTHCWKENWWIHTFPMWIESGQIFKLRTACLSPTTNIFTAWTSSTSNSWSRCSRSGRSRIVEFTAN